MKAELALLEHLKQIRPANPVLAEIASAREDELAKPAKSLGMLETLAIKLSAIQNTLRPHHEHKLMVVCAGDHGVVDEGVSPWPKSVTYQQVLNFSHGGGAITTISRAADVKVLLLDVGVDYEFPPFEDEESLSDPLKPIRLSRKVAFGTQNLAKGPAMSREEAVLSILAGLETVLSVPRVDLVGAGEMGIGNTTPSSCIAAVFTGMSPDEATGIGSGLNEAERQNKVKVVARALEINKPDPNDPIDVLAKVGGLEIGAMAGVYLGGAIRRAGVVMDGFIGAAAALIAEKLSPGLSEYMIAGHKSKEKAHQRVLDYLGLTPLLDLGMWLGEGSGAAVAMMILKAACCHFNNMATFSESAVANRHESVPLK
ncbi:MAG: nicotinate-nucleotide--dimethylbenzimidazole phosphoribosyltransferase [Deltaproteobacteria bacterium]|jgi:nicotinate-nucleotide--dimethylbenzimidazole phosphoribosyltransferase|nr:nicotinate-nucleotide--dimethylbenzimidazole phosphoribosyltransferase [Deltaproteobacteria bacterium]